MNAPHYICAFRVSTPSKRRRYLPRIRATRENGRGERAESEDGSREEHGEAESF